MLKKFMLMAGMAGLVLLTTIPVQAASYDTDAHFAMATGVTTFVEPRQRAEAIALVLGNEFAVAGSGGYPNDTPIHFHSDDTDSFGVGTDWMEVGEFGDSAEEMRGMVEFDITGGFTADSASVDVQVAQLGGLFGQPGPGDFTIEVYIYDGNNAEDISDYNIAGTLLTSFGTSGLTAGQFLQFDVTDAFNTAVGAAATSFGVRFQPASAPAGAAVVFGDATLTMATAPPLPPMAKPVPSGTPTGLMVLLLVIMTAGLVVLRSRAGS